MTSEQIERYNELIRRNRYAGGLTDEEKGELGYLSGLRMILNAPPLLEIPNTNPEPPTEPKP